MTKKKMQHNKLRRSADPDFVSTAGNVDLLPAPGTGNMTQAGLLTVILPHLRAVSTQTGKALPSASIVDPLLFSACVFPSASAVRNAQCSIRFCR